jgi:protein phosphatase
MSPHRSAHAGPRAAHRPRDADLDFFGLTHPGRVRRENQDHFLYSTLHKTMRVGGTSLPNPELLELPSERIASFGMVADGVGGRDGGETASRAVAETIAGYLTRTMLAYYTTDVHDQSALLDALTEGASVCHDAVVRRAAEGGHLNGAATTLTAILAVWPALYVLQVGDSRCYRFRAGRLEQLTRDQTVAEDMVQAGILPRDRAARSGFANVLSSSLGGRITVPVVTRTDLDWGDVILLCTDGLTKHVSDDRIAERLAGLRSSEDACRALVGDALAGGGTDNVTVVVLRAVVREARSA